MTEMLVAAIQDDAWAVLDPVHQSAEQCRGAAVRLEEAAYGFLCGTAGMDTTPAADRYLVSITRFSLALQRKDAASLRRFLLCSSSDKFNETPIVHELLMSKSDEEFATKCASSF
jgi:hypothetical protein